MSRAKQWDKLGWEVVQSPSLEVLKTQVDKAPGSLSDPMTDPALSRRLDLSKSFPAQIILWSYAKELQ